MKKEKERIEEETINDNLRVHIMNHLEISVSKNDDVGFQVRLWNDTSQRYVLSQICWNEKAKDLFVDFIKQNWIIKRDLDKQIT